MSLFYNDGGFEYTVRNAHAIFTDNRRGAYTTICTVDGTHIFRLTQHANRLVDTIFSMTSTPYVRDYDLENLSDLRHYTTLNHVRDAYSDINVDSMKKYMANLTQFFLQRYKEDYEYTGELRVYFMIEAYKSEPVFFALAEKLPHPDTYRNTFVAVVAHRDNPNVKDTAWMTKRESLAAMVKDRVEEVIMLTSEEEGLITEGISSNFFVVKQRPDGAKVVQTASTEFILVGTVRNTVLKVCADLQYAVEETTPCIHEVDTWVGCFVTSTSRGAKPAAVLRWGDKEFHFSTEDGDRINAGLEKAKLGDSELISNSLR